MKIVLTTLNAKFIHTSLALRVLGAYCQDDYPEIELAEYTINDHLDGIIGSLAEKAPDILGFSCYIWNITEIIRIGSTIRQILPQCRILLGGPEVSHDPSELMMQHRWIDYIVMGEGEVTFKALLDSIRDNGPLTDITGLVWRSGDQVVTQGPRPVLPQLDSIPFPYAQGFKKLAHKILYYETSRGCPFRCQYCLSSIEPGVRYLSMERVKRDLKVFIDAGISQVKLVDRTFNCHARRAQEIFEVILSLGGKTNFHFEMAGHLIDDEMCEILAKAPPGLFQFEIGIQSTNPQTLEVIQRSSDLPALTHRIRQIAARGNIHLHLDLIAGLPHEDYDSMAQSFNEVLALAPDRLQLGFLKLLKGSGLRTHAAQYDYKYTEYPPYEVLSSHVLSYRELLRLKQMEELLEDFYNSHRFDESLRYIMEVFQKGAFRLFEAMTAYRTAGDHEKATTGMLQRYAFLLGFGRKVEGVDTDMLRELLLFDYLCQGKPARIPEELLAEGETAGVGAQRDFLQSNENITRWIPHLSNLPVKQISRHIHVQGFDVNVLDWQKGKGTTPVKLLFDYSRKDVLSTRPAITAVGP